MQLTSREVKMLFSSLLIENVSNLVINLKMSSQMDKCSEESTKLLSQNNYEYVQLFDAVLKRHIEYSRMHCTVKYIQYTVYILI